MERQTLIRPYKSSADWAGALCSAACAVHCAATPILLAMLPSVSSVRWLADPLFHQIVAVVCALLMWRAIMPGYRIYNDWQVLAYAGGGIGLLLAAAFVLPDTCCEASRHLALHTSGTNSGGQTLFAGLGSSDPNAIGLLWHGVSIPIGRPLFSPDVLANGLGHYPASILACVHPYLSPLGGFLLIVAHLLNIVYREHGTHSKNRTR